MTGYTDGGLRRRAAETRRWDEPMWCPFCRSVRPHALFLHADGVTEWCQVCLRVHVYEIVGGDRWPVLRPVATPDAVMRD